MQIALLTPRFWPEVRRGTERFVHDLARGLSALGHRPTIITSALRPGWSSEEGVTVLSVPRVPLPDRAGLEPHLTHLPWLAAALRALRPDVAHAFSVTDAAVAARWARRDRRAAVFTHMGIPDAADLCERRGRRARTLRVAEGATVLTLSEHSARAWLQTTGLEARVIAPGVDLERFAVGTERTRQPTVLCVAAVEEPRKRVGLLLDAWPLVRMKHPEARLLLDRRGAGAVRSGIAGVEFVQLDDTFALATRNARAWAAALPSRSEAFGLALLEALATGTPVVGTREAGMQGLVDSPAVGRLVVGGAAELAAGIDETFTLALDPATRAACRARAMDFPVERTAREHAALYEELIRSRTRSR